MTRYAARAPAKVNLCLHVGPPRDDGRHPLESLVVFAGPEAADTVSAYRGSEDELSVSGPFAAALEPAGSNLILDALARLRGQIRVRPERDSPISFELRKALPVAAGIGGGSADAAAALRLLTREIFDLPAHVATDIAPQLGGDVLACVYSAPALMRGDGDEVVPLLKGPTLDLLTRGGLPAVLVNPGLPCPTGPVFRHFDALEIYAPLEPLQIPDFASRTDLIDWLAHETRNDLEAAAVDLVPEIGFLLEHLREIRGARLVRMSGSGATCFALFDHMDDALLAQVGLMKQAPHWWVRATRLGEGV
ncbi:MAG: 4-(cytidine 5'-diphospho)-2-C-methyl-D-erythritol kinase [Hyphomonadaceae bacterium]|nr:4-(cytidine 5'-diphospho)-2-C-methyl-D-erythritol kinase [Hyphomonadaceae bacterium]